MMSVAFFPAICKVYGLFVGWFAELVAVFSEKSPAYYEEILKFKGQLSTRLENFAKSPALLHAADKCQRWYSARSSTIATSWTHFLEQHPPVKAKVVLATNFVMKIFQFAVDFLQGTAEKLLQHPSLQSILLQPRFQSLASHPILKWLFQHPKLKENYPVNSYHQTAAIATNFLGGISVSARKAASDPKQVTMNFQTDPANIHKFVNHLKAIDENAMAADNFVWMCLCVFTVVVVTSLSWLAVMLASRGPKYRRTVHAIALLVTSVLFYFIFYFSVKLQSLDKDVHSIFKFLLAGSYIPFLILIVIVYIRTWGRQVSDKSSVSQTQYIENDKALLGLKKDLLDANTAHENRRLSLELSEKDGADMKARLSVLSDDLLSAQKSKEEALKTLEEEQKRIADLPTKTMILSMDMESEGSMMMPSSHKKSSQGRSVVISDADKKIAEAQADSAREITELTAKLAVVQDELTVNRAALSAKETALSDQLAAGDASKADFVKQGQATQSKHDKVVSELQKQVAALEAAHTKALSNVTAAQETSRLSVLEAEKMKANQKARMQAIQTELAASVTTSEAAAKQVEAEQKKLTVLSGEKAVLQSALDGLTVQLETAKKESLALTASLSTATAALNGERTKATTAAAAADQKVKDLTARLGEVEKETTALSGQIVLLDSQVASAKAGASDVVKDVAAKKKLHDDEVSSMRKKITELEAEQKTKVQAIQTELAASVTTSEAAAKQVEAEQKKLTVLSGEKAVLQSALDGLTVQLETAKKESLALTASLSTATAALNAERAKATTAVAAADQKVKDLTARLGEVQKEKAAVEHQQTRSLSSAREIHAASEEEKNLMSQDRETLKEQHTALETKLTEATAAARSAESNHAAAMVDVLAKLASTQDSWRAATQEGVTSKEHAKAAADDLQKLVAEKNSELAAVQARLREVEAARAAGQRETEEVKARLTAQLAKSAADSATSEEELREVESQLESFVEVCNSTRASLVAAQDDLRVSETRRKEDAASFQVKLKDAEEAKVTLSGRLESDRVKLVALEVQAITAASTGETGLDHLQGLLDASEVEKKRILVQVDELRVNLSTSKTEIADLQSKREADLSILQARLEEVQMEKQAAITEIDAISVRLKSSQDVISFFEKEREEDIKSMQVELKASARARKQIIEDFVAAKGDLEAEEVELRKSQPVSPSRGNHGSLFLHSPPRTPEAGRSPVSSSIEVAMMKQTIEDLTMAKEVAVNDCQVIQKRLESALFDLEQHDGQRGLELEQMQHALAALELLEEERDELQAEVDSLREQLGMPPLTHICTNDDRDLLDRVEVNVVEKRPSLILSNPARPVSAAIRSRTNSQEHPTIVASEPPVAAPVLHSSMASVSNPMLVSTNPLRLKAQGHAIPVEAPTVHPVDGPLPLIMTSRLLWANAKTVALMRGKRKSAPALIPLTSIESVDVANAELISDIDQVDPNCSVKVKQSLEHNSLC